MPSVAEIVEMNRALANRINKEARSDPQSPYAGKKVALANGEVVAVGDTWEEVIARLDQVQRDRRKTAVFDASADYDTPVWV
jgi:hypothetical protein